MFDVAFSELIVIGVVGLIVIGPEKLPKVARTLGMLAGRMQRYVSDVKTDIERQMQYEDLQKIQQEISQSFIETKAEVESVGQTITGEVAALEKSVESLVEKVTVAPTATDVEPVAEQAKPLSATASQSTEELPALLTPSDVKESSPQKNQQ